MATSRRYLQVSIAIVLSTQLLRRQLVDAWATLGRRCLFGSHRGCVPLGRRGAEGFVETDTWTAIAHLFPMQL